MFANKEDKAKNNRYTLYITLVFFNIAKSSGFSEEFANFFDCVFQMIVSICSLLYSYYSLF